jgi:hypothetical protein
MQSALAAKQDTLVSGNSIKTVNSTSLLGSGDIVITGGAGDALVSNPLSQFASTTSSQLRGVISDETGSGSLVFSTSPTFTTPNLGVASATRVLSGAGSAASPSITVSDGASGLWRPSANQIGVSANNTDVFRFASTVVYCFQDLVASGKVQFGTQDASTPMLKKSGTTICARLSNDSADTAIAAGKLILSDSLKVGIRTIATLPLASTCNGETFEVSDSPIFGNRFVKSDGVVWYYEGTSYEVGTSPASGGLQPTNNLSDVSSVSTSRTNLGLGTLATQNGHPGYISGNWYHFSEDASTGTGTALGSGNIRLTPFLLRDAVSINSLGTRVSTVSAGGNIQLAIYGNNNATGRPTGNALITTASISTSVVGVVSAVNAGGDTTLAPGLYWMAVNADNATVICQPGITITMSRMGYLVGNATQSNISGAAGSVTSSLAVTQAFGTWPDLTGATFVESISSVQITANALIHFKHV